MCFLYVKKSRYRLAMGEGGQEEERKQEALVKKIGKKVWHYPLAAAWTGRSPDIEVLFGPPWRDDGIRSGRSEGWTIEKSGFDSEGQ